VQALQRSTMQIWATYKRKIAHINIHDVCD